MYEREKLIRSPENLKDQIFDKSKGSGSFSSKRRNSSPLVYDYDIVSKKSNKKNKIDDLNMYSKLNSKKRDKPKQREE